MVWQSDYSVSQRKRVERERAWKQSNLAMTKAKQFYMNPGWSQSWTSCKEWISKGASKHPVTYQIIPTLRTIIVTKSFNFLIFSHFTSIKYSESSETIRNILVQILCMTIFQHQKSIWIHWHYSVQNPILRCERNLYNIVFKSPS